jgi:hypothetical protein
MHWNAPSKQDENKKIMLNNRSLKAKECATCGWQDNKEFQWDCLNNINVSTSCMLSSHRTLNWR